MTHRMTEAELERAGEAILRVLADPESMHASLVRLLEPTPAAQAAMEAAGIELEPARWRIRERQTRMADPIVFVPSEAFTGLATVLTGTDSRIHQAPTGPGGIAPLTLCGEAATAGVPDADADGQFCAKCAKESEKSAKATEPRERSAKADRAATKENGEPAKVRRARAEKDGDAAPGSAAYAPTVADIEPTPDDGGDTPDHA